MSGIKSLYNFDKKIVLASASPRRKKLLEQIELDFEIIVSNVDEDTTGDFPPEVICCSIALDKARDVAQRLTKPSIVIGADTIVVLDDKVLGKPDSEQEAAEMLRALSGNSHYVYTGLAFIDTTTGTEKTVYEKTKVQFRELTDSEIHSYIETGSPMDKAGAYGIQDDFGAVFVSRIEGCYYNVVGLPLQLFFQCLDESLN
jgi:septum formation protein